MVEAVHIEAIERLLATVSSRGETLLSSFMFGRPGAPIWERHMMTSIFVDRRSFTQALLFIRQNGAPYLRDISISALWSMVTEFVREQFWHVARTTFPSNSHEPYSIRVPPEDKLALAEALAASPMFHPKVELTLYPLVPVRVLDDFECERFFLTAASRLDHSHLPASAARSELDPSNFPPFADYEGYRQTPSAWLGVRSPLPLVSDKVAAAILGAIALTPLPRYRYMFSGRKVFGGTCTISEGYSVSGREDAHTPRMMEDIAITTRDHDWLKTLLALIDAQDKPSRSKVRALEYFYRAWFLDPRERFPALCMSLDSMVGANHGHTMAAVNFVRNLVSMSIDEQRLRLLMRVRGAVIHGAAPDVYESENYAQYYVNYGADPIKDLELVVAKCLRDAVFQGKLQYHPDPNAAVLAKMQAEGRLPKNLAPETIIPADD